MESKLSRWCDGVIEAGWLAAIILTPLFFNIHSDRVFEPDKLTLLRSIALLMLGVWLIKFVDQKGWQDFGQTLGWRSPEAIWHKPFIIPIVLLVIIYLISNLFSVTPAISWAGSYQRLQGTYTTLSYIVIFGVTISTMRTTAQARRLVTAVIITSIPVSFYGLLQHFDLDPLPWAGDTQTRVAGHMGNAIFIAAYLIMAVPLTLSRIIVSFNNILNDDDLSAADVLRSSIYIFTLAIQLITIYWSGSRGPWIGLFVGLFAFVLIVLVALRNATEENGRFQFKDGGKALLLVAAGVVALPLFNLLFQWLGQRTPAFALAPAMISFISFVTAVGFVVLAIFVLIAAQQGWRWLWLSWIILSLTLGLWLVAFNLPSETTDNFDGVPLVNGLFDTLDEWRSLSTIGRLGTVLEADSGTGRVRTLIWEGVLELLAPHEPLRFPDGRQDSFNFLRPLIGYGPESMYVAYNRYYPPELATVEARNASPDRSHNETFDALVITGWLGFLTWQFLYLSVFYFGFKWLGVLTKKRDGYLLIGLWVGMGALVALLFGIFLGPVYLGVAFPFGSIVGLILYLIYFALLGESPMDAAAKRPFATNRMLMVALVAAILAHYVEIHFGIAIASSRTHFFLYVGIMFVLGHLLPQLQPQDKTAALAEEREIAEAPAKKGKRGRSRRGSRSPRRRPAVGAVGGPMMFSLFVMSLITGTIGFEYITYNQPAGREFATISDLPVSEVVHQSFFVDAGKNFADSPFIFVMLVLTWALGTILIVSEMVKDGELEISPTLNLATSRRMLLMTVLLILGVITIGVRFFFPVPVGSGSAFLLGRALLSAYGVSCILIAILLYIQSPSSQFVTGILAVAGLASAFPILMAGAWWQAILLLLINSWLFYEVRDGTWGKVLTRTAVLAVGAFGIGVTYTYFHAWIFRNSLFFQPPAAVETLSEFRILESSQAAFFLSMFYFFVMGLILLMGYLANSPEMSRLRQSGTNSGFAALAGIAILLIWLIPATNLKIIQADMIFKRGRFFDSQATGSGNQDLWQSAIAIYNRSIALAPREDYYYLFLGRAFLENSTIATDETQQLALLSEAEGQLNNAQKINPLNTDHTANLARLSTRWVGFTDSDSERRQRISQAEDYYQDALALSPQNSIIRNEYARLAFDLKRDCDQSIALFEESIDIDPYYSDTYFWLVDTQYRCGLEESDEEAREAYFNAGLESIEAGLEVEPNNPRAWLRASQLYTQLSEPQAAIDALDKVRELDPTQTVLANWNYNYSKAQLNFGLGQTDLAIALAQEAVRDAPPEFVPQIQQYITQIGGPPAPIPDPLPETAVPDEGILTGERPLTAVPAAQRNNIFPSYPNFIINPANEYQAVIVTEKGDIRVQLYAAEAPLTVNNFVFLANQGFYDDTTFHRVIEGFMAQAGDPTGTGSGSPGYQFEDETGNGLIFDRPGLLAMANAGPNTNGSQFFITYDATSWLDGNHTIFGEIIDGQSVLESLTLRDPATATEPGDRILRIDIIENTP